MKAEPKNYLEGYANILFYILIIMATVVGGNLTNSWSSNTPQTIILIMSILVLFDVFRQLLIDPKKGKKIRKILLLLVIILVILGVIAFLLTYRFIKLT
jgi:hypothetical protein